MLEWLKAGNEENKSAIAFFHSFLQGLGTILESKVGPEYKSIVKVSIFIMNS